MLHLRYMLACNDQEFDKRVESALDRRSRGISSIQDTEQKTDDEELAQEQTVVDAWVPRGENIWGALRGDSNDDEDTEDFELSADWGEDRSEIEEEDYFDDESSVGELPVTLRIQDDDDHPRIASSKESSPGPEDGDSTNDNIKDEENEGFEGEEDGDIVDEDVDFLMKYCV